MGAHYRSLQIWGKSPDVIISALENQIRERKGKALIGPEMNGWTAVYLGDFVPSDDIAPTLASRLNTKVLDLTVHDSDIFTYCFYEGNRVADEYSSHPDYFEEVPPTEHKRLEGNSEAFRDLLKSEERVSELDSVLKAQDSDEFTFEEDRLERFAKLLGIENALSSYDYLIDGEWDCIKGRRQFIHVPDLTAEKTAVKAAAAAVRAELKRFKKEGTLLFESRPHNKHAITVGEAVFDPLRGGLLFRWDSSNRAGNLDCFTANPENCLNFPHAALVVQEKGTMAVITSDAGLRQEIAELRKDQRNWNSIFEISSTYALFGFTFWAMHQHPSWWLYTLAFCFLGFLQYRLVMSTHEATHKTLFFPTWLNEFFGVFHSALVGISFFNYRKTHLEHHKNPQSIDEDIDSYIYRPLLETKPGFRRLGLLVFGVVFDIAMKVKRKLVGATRRATNEVVRNETNLFRQMGPIIACQVGLFAFFSYYLHWWHYFVFWITPVLLIALSLDRARTFLEHGYQYIFSNQTWDSFKDAPQSTVDIDTNAFERYFFAPFGFAYHQAHHTYLTVPYYNLDKLADLLESREEKYFRRVKGSYVTILAKMIWAKK